MTTQPVEPRRRTTCRVISVGLGPIGMAVAKAATAIPRMIVVAAVEIDQAVVGKDLGEVTGSEALQGAKVFGDLASALAQTDANLLVHCATSSISAALGTISAAVVAGLNVVSTCEELAYPFYHHPDEAEHIDQAAKDAGVTVLGCGVNPGHVMDILPALLARCSLDITHVRVSRVVDASTRRRQMLDKIGVGLSPEEFQSRLDRGAVGHVGLPESAAMLADALGFWPSDIASSIEPVVSQVPCRVGETEIPANRVLGVRQNVQAYRGASPLVSLSLEMTIGAHNPEDRIEVQGNPSLEVVVPGGTPGDEATVAIVVNVLPTVLAAPPGLLTMVDLPLRRPVTG